MGGYGSGRYNYGSSKYTVEDGFIIDFNMIAKNGGILPRTASLVWYRNDIRIGSIGYTVTNHNGSPMLELNYTCNGVSVHEPIQIVSTSQHFGNERYWMLCPIMKNGLPCHRRCYKLYQPPNSKYFGCRECMDLTYKSCKESHKFDSLFASIAEEMNLPTWAVKRALRP